VCRCVHVEVEEINADAADADGEIGAGQLAGYT
jgi:hypothetical protein